MRDFNYSKAEADLYDVGCHCPEEIYEYTTESGFCGYMKEHGLNPEKYRTNTQKSSGSYGNSGTEGCYITTACVAARGLADDCDELETLRYFRDSYLKTRRDGIADIRQYYSSAPLVVKAINTLPEAKEIWGRVYTDMIKPCVDLIKQAEYEETYRLYKEYVKELADKYLH